MKNLYTVNMRSWTIMQTLQYLNVFLTYKTCASPEKRELLWASDNHPSTVNLLTGNYSS